MTLVQYTQTDTIRQTDGPLVPMIRLVPTEKVVIPNGSIGEQKQVKKQTCHENSSFYQPSIQNKFALTPSRNALIVVMNIPRSININRAQQVNVIRRAAHYG